MKYVLFNILLIFRCLDLFSQNLSSQLQFDSLLFELHQALYVQKSIEIEEIENVHSITVWHFVPNLNYDFINKNYYLTVSSSHLITTMLGKRQEKKQLSAIERRYESRLKTNEIKLKSLLLSINQKFDNLRLSGIILSNDIEIYKIKKTQNINNEIDTETFLNEKSQILTKIRNHNNQLIDIQQSLFQIEEITEVSIQIDLQNFRINPDDVL
jgi:hypothetical protein